MNQDELKRQLLQHFEKGLLAIMVLVALWYVLFSVQPWDFQVEVRQDLPKTLEKARALDPVPIRSEEGRKEEIDEINRQIDPQRLTARIFQQVETGDRRVAYLADVVNLAQNVPEPRKPEIVPTRDRVPVVHLAKVSAHGGLSNVQVTMVVPRQRQNAVIERQLQLPRKRRMANFPATLVRIVLQRRIEGQTDWKEIGVLDRMELQNQLAQWVREQTRRPREDVRLDDRRPDRDFRVIDPTREDDDRRGPRQPRFDGPMPDDVPWDDGNVGPGPGGRAVSVDARSLDIWVPQGELKGIRDLTFHYRDLQVDLDKRYQYRALMYITNPLSSAEGDQTQRIAPVARQDDQAVLDWDGAPRTALVSPKTDRDFRFVGGSTGTTVSDASAVVRVLLFRPTFDMIPLAAFEKLQDAGVINWVRIKGDDKHVYGMIEAENWTEVAGLTLEPREKTGYWYHHDFGKTGSPIRIGDPIGGVVKDQPFVPMRRLVLDGREYWMPQATPIERVKQVPIPGGAPGMEPEPRREPGGGLPQVDIDIDLNRPGGGQPGGGMPGGMANRERKAEPVVVRRDVPFVTGYVLLDVLTMLPPADVRSDPKALRPAKLYMAAMNDAGQVLQKMKDDSIKLYEQAGPVVPRVRGRWGVDEFDPMFGP